MKNQIKILSQDLIKTLAPKYGEREARSITRIVFEDGLGIFNLSQERELEQDAAGQLKAIGERLLQGEPVQYVLGQAHFFGLMLEVTPDVLIPRPETEELVSLILEQERGYIPKLWDIGTGSGCIPIALKHRQPAWAITGADISLQALALARANAEKLGLDIEWIELDALSEKSWEAMPSEVDIIVSNPPYIPPSEQELMPEWVLGHEPHLALFTATEDSIQFYREIAAQGRKKLKKGGRLYFELNEHSSSAIAQEVKRQGYKSVEVFLDMSGKNRMLRAVLSH